MSVTLIRRRLGPSAATVLLLVAGAACSSSDQGATGGATSGTSPAATTSATGTESSGATASASSTASASASTSTATATATATAEPTGPEKSKKPVKLDKPSTTGTGLTAKLVSIKAIKATAQMPGEIAGPALAITVSITNAGKKTADLSSVVVNLADSDQAPGNPMSAKPSAPFHGSLKAGKTARGIYVFTVPTKKRKPITLTVSIGDAPVLVFTGNAG